VRAGALLVLALVLAGAAAAEEELFRQVKIDVFDQDWPAVLKGCDAILARFPAGDSSTQAAFYRATALSHLEGREDEAILAFRRFVADHPSEKVLTEEAWSGLFRLACAPRGRARADCPALLREGLGSRSPYVSTLAAIRAGDLPDDELRRRALPVLKRAYARETESEIRDEVLLAILKIDPKQVPVQQPPTEPPSRPRRPGKKAPTLIRLTVYNKAEGRYEVRVNLPIAFARMLIDAVGEEQRDELRQEAREKGIDLDDIFEAIEKAGAGKLLEVDDEESRVEIWIE
jgi:hypothetical protein